MRPPAGGDALTRSRKASFANPEATTPTASLGHGVPTNFFIASESMLEGPEVTSSRTGSDCNFGVQSLEDTIEGIGPPADDQDEDESSIDHGPERRRRSTIKDRAHYHRGPSLDSLGETSAISSASSSPPRLRQRHQNPSGVSQASTPVSLASLSHGSSLPGSPKSTSTRSLRNSDEESMGDSGSQAITSSGDEDVDPPSATQENAPQLIMPSIRMPSRRPFTERGRDIGRLKILLAGGSGVGKTSLIKSIVQVCEDIVHVDPLASNTPSLPPLPSKQSRGKKDQVSSGSTKHITEVYASTKAYPSWWSDLDESRILRRRKSSGDVVLERNLCFVDTPGYCDGTPVTDTIDSVMEYIETQMAKTTSLGKMSDGDLLSILGGNGGFQVDVVFYLISRHLDLSDIEFMKRLSRIINVIPLIAKSDTLSYSEAQELKVLISDSLCDHGLKPLNFPSNDAPLHQPYTVCSAPSNDEDNMDASLLMSPEYVRPLVPSELVTLMEHVFDKDNMSWLRYAAAKKIIQWREAMHSRPKMVPLGRSLPPHLSNIVTAPSTSSSMVSSFSTASGTLVSHPHSPSSYLQARIADHIYREERLAEFQLANWAGDLRRSLQNERARYEALARGEQLGWLTERLSHYTQDEAMVLSQRTIGQNSAPDKAIVSLRDSSSTSLRHRRLANPADPLGIIRWSETMKQRGWIAFQLVGSFGVLGAVAVWIARSWGLGVGDGLGSWTTGWFGGIE